MRLLLFGYKLDEMCRRCVKELLPKRGSTCLDSGHYILNWAGCDSCKSRDVPIQKIRVFTVNDEEAEEALYQINPVGGSTGAAETITENSWEEEVTFQHVCPSCEHLVCEH